LPGGANGGSYTTDGRFVNLLHRERSVADVRLVDLEVLKRFSLVLRREFADAEDVLAALDTSRGLVLAALGRPAPAQAAGQAPARPVKGGAKGQKAPAK